MGVEHCLSTVLSGMANVSREPVITAAAEAEGIAQLSEDIRRMTVRQWQEDYLTCMARALPLEERSQH